MCLWTAAADSFPARPARPSFSHALAAPLLRGLLQTVVDEVGYRLV
jgi:hypothetical protein